MNTENTTSRGVVIRLLDDPLDESFAIMYREVLQPAFPSGELDELDSIRLYLSRNGSGGTMSKFLVLCLFELDKPVGVAVFNVTVADSLVLMNSEYTAVHPGRRSCGYGRKLCIAREQLAERLARELAGQELDLCIVAANDPQKMSVDATTSRCRKTQAELTEKMWRRYGYRKVVFDFVQLPLSVGKPPVFHLSLWVKTTGERYTHRDYLTSEEAMLVAKVMNMNRATSLAVGADPHFSHMCEQLVSSGRVFLA